MPCRRLQIVSATDVSATVRFGDDAFVVYAEDALRGARDSVSSVADGLRVGFADELEAWNEREDMAEQERVALLRVRNPRKRRRPVLRLLTSGPKTHGSKT
jgi:hypothetical protein